MVELEPITPGGIQKPLLKKASARSLNGTAPLGGRPKASTSLRRPVTLLHPSTPPKPTKGSPGRSLTVRIEDDMTGYRQVIQSAPAKIVRRLPAVPVPAATADANTSQSEPTTPYSTPAIMESQTPPRVIRPLPCPPPLANAAPNTLPQGESSKSCPPTERPRVRLLKPLPVPVLKVEPLVLNRKSSSMSSRPQTLSTLKSPSLPTLTPTPLISIAHAHDEKTSSQDSETDFYDEPEEDEESNVIQLQDRLLLRNRTTLSLDSNTTNEHNESESEPTFLQAHVITFKNTKNENKGREDVEHFVDYTWMLSNRILYRQDDGSRDGDPQFGGKWMLEKKGKRYTEQDYENVLQVLRSL